MLLRYVYIVFIGLLLALFIGIGIAAFYPSPKRPDYITSVKIPREPITASDSAQIREDEIKNQEIQKEFDSKDQLYNKNVAILTVIASILVLGVSLVFSKKLLILADGLLFGGLLTLIYSLIRSFGTQDYKFMFMVITVGLVVSVYLGYLKLIKQTSN